MPKNQYKKPVIVDLSGLSAEGQVQCRVGTGAGGEQCKSGFTAGKQCQAGSAASGGKCDAGSAAAGNCQSGSAPGGRCGQGAALA